MRIPIFVLAALAPLTLGAIAMAQTSRPSDERMDRFEKRLTEIEEKYKSDLKARDEEIAKLRQELAQRPTTGPSSAPSQDAIKQTTDEILKDIQTNHSGPFSVRTPASFLPDIAVITDAQGNVSTLKSNPAYNRFDVDQVELELRAAVDPRADAVAVLPVTRTVDNPLFFNPDDVDGDINTNIEIEEAYILLHDFGIANLTAKVGRFHLHFGRWNLLHSHDWPTADNNFVNQSFLAPEAISGSGVSLSYVIPPKLVGDQYIEAIAEIISGEGDEENPVFNNNALIGQPAFNGHILWNHDITRDWNIEVGGSWMTGNRNDTYGDRFNLFGTDVTVMHTDPKGRFNNQIVQVEAIYGNVDTAPSTAQYAWGAFLWGQAQLNRDWYAGCRLDWTKNAVDESQDVYAVSPYVSWYWSEFLRFRLEYQYKAGDVPTANTVYFQVTWVFGSHPPHPYWSVK